MLYRISKWLYQNKKGLESDTLGLRIGIMCKHKELTRIKNVWICPDCDEEFVIE